MPLLFESSQAPKSGYRSWISHDQFSEKKKVADVQPHGPWPQCQGFCEDEQGLIKRKCAAVILSPTSDLHVGDWRTQILGLRHAAT